jgi:hypothetical protein
VSTLRILGFLIATTLASGGGLAPAASGSGPVTCSPRLAQLFAPPHPQFGRYEVCSTPSPLAAVNDRGWRPELLAPFDALGQAGSYDRAAVARLYGARRPQVARGWIRSNGQLESVTLVSPYPNPTLTQLDPGTLIIRLIICCL